MPPNNWVSQFGGSAWTFDASTEQYYLHSFLREQPDLNWRNPAVRHAMYDVLRFWLNREVDGFRVDVLWLLIKDAELRDNPPNPNYRLHDAEINRHLNIYNGDQPQIHEVVAEMRSILDQYDQRVLIGEIYLPVERLVSYYGNSSNGLQLPFNFQLISTPWNAPKIAQLVQDYEKALPPGGWPNWVLGNHDQPRIAARVGEAQARVASMLLLTLRGTPTMYYGDELGIGRVKVQSELVQDPWEKTEPGLGLGRDPWRTPFQWNSSTNAGFTKGQPWLPLDPDYRRRNAKELKKDPTSILCLYKQLIELRRRCRAVNNGTYRSIGVEDNIFAYERRSGDNRIIIALNMGMEGQSVSALLGITTASVLLSTHLDRSGPISELTLRANEGVILGMP
jgi:alpha-glucosidase